MLRIITRYVQAVSVRPLSAVSSLVRFSEEPQMFAIEFNDGCPIHVSYLQFYFWFPWGLTNLKHVAWIVGIRKYVSGWLTCCSSGCFAIRSR